MARFNPTFSTYIAKLVIIYQYLCAGTCSLRRLYSCMAAVRGCMEEVWRKLYIEVRAS